jgi:hypothetical protein
MGAYLKNTRRIEALIQSGEWTQDSYQDLVEAAKNQDWDSFEATCYANTGLRPVDLKEYRARVHDTDAGMLTLAFLASPDSDGDLTDVHDALEETGELDQEDVVRLSPD